MCLCLLALLGIVGALVLTTTYFDEDNSDEASTDDLAEMSGPSSSPPWTTKVREPISTKRQMASSTTKVTIHSMPTAASTGRPNVFDKPQNYTDYNNEKHDQRQ
ncbi:hypothetical protein MRX96_052774 [Rhipicephalus microplus]